MKKLIFITLILSGCANVPLESPKFPEAPAEIQQACPVLKTVDTANPKLSDTLSVVVANYGQYKECSAKVDAWNSWYNSQKDIYSKMP